MVYYIAIALKVSCAGDEFCVNMVTIMFQVAQRRWKEPFLSYQLDDFI